MDITKLEQQTIGQVYRLATLIGVGSTGAVYRARHQELGRDVAIKVIGAPYNEPEFAPFFREVGLRLATLRHDYIVPTHNFQHDGRIAFLVMPYLSGGSLRQRLRETHDWPGPQTVSLVLQVAEALRFAHQRGLTHGHLTSDAILFDKDQPMLTGFEAALLRETFEREKGRLLPPASAFLMSPEQIQQQPVTEAVDQYHLGLLAYHMLTGQPAFDGLSSERLQAQHSNDIPAALHDHNPALPTALNSVVQRALSKRPADRYLSIEAFTEAFAEASRDLPRQQSVPSAEVAAAPSFLSTPTSGRAAAPVSSFYAPAYSEIIDISDKTPPPIPPNPPRSRQIIFVPLLVVTGIIGIGLVSRPASNRITSALPTSVASRPISTGTEEVTVEAVITYDFRATQTAARNADATDIARATTAARSTAAVFIPIATDKIAVVATNTETDVPTETPKPTQTATPTVQPRSPTPAPTETAIAIPLQQPGGSSVLFRDDFETGHAQRWTTTGNPVVVWDAETFNHTLTFEEGGTAKYGADSEWREYTLEFRVLMENNVSDYNLTILVYDGTRGYYAVGLDTAVRAQIVDNRNTSLASPTGAREALSMLERNTWYTVRVEIDGRRIRLYLNGSLMVTAYDERLTKGGIGFMASRGARVQIDDVVVTGPAQAQTSLSQQNLVTDIPFLYIDPVSGPRGTNHIITVMSLQPDEEIEFDIFFEGQSILTGVHTADATGVAFFEIFSERNDPPGEYFVEARHNGDIIATGVLIVEE